MSWAAAWLYGLSPAQSEQVFAGVKPKTSDCFKLHQTPALHNK